MKKLMTIAAIIFTLSAVGQINGEMGVMISPETISVHLSGRYAFAERKAVVRATLKQAMNRYSEGIKAEGMTVSGQVGGVIGERLEIVAGAGFRLISMEKKEMNGVVFPASIRYAIGNHGVVGVQYTLNSIYNRAEIVLALAF